MRWSKSYSYFVRVLALVVVASSALFPGKPLMASMEEEIVRAVCSDAGRSEETTLGGLDRSLLSSDHALIHDIAKKMSVAPMFDDNLSTRRKVGMAAKKAFILWRDRLRNSGFTSDERLVLTEFARSGESIIWMHSFGGGRYARRKIFVSGTVETVGPFTSFKTVVHEAAHHYFSRSSYRQLYYKFFESEFEGFGYFNMILEEIMANQISHHSWDAAYALTTEYSYKPIFDDLRLRGLLPEDFELWAVDRKLDFFRAGAAHEDQVLHVVVERIVALQDSDLGRKWVKFLKFAGVQDSFQSSVGRIGVESVANSEIDRVFNSLVKKLMITPESVWNYR